MAARYSLLMCSAFRSWAEGVIMPVWETSASVLLTGAAFNG